MLESLFDLAFYVELVAMTALSVFAFVLYRKLRTSWSILILVGTIIMVLVLILKFFVQYVFVDFYGTTISTGEISTSYVYVREVIFFLGVLTAATGFAGFAITTKE